VDKAVQSDRQTDHRSRFNAQHSGEAYKHALGKAEPIGGLDQKHADRQQLTERFAERKTGVERNQQVAGRPELSGTSSNQLRLVFLSTFLIAFLTN
jgi:hypothetical protein